MEPVIRRHLQVLASDSLEGRGNYSEGLKKAAAYIRQQFLSAGLRPFLANDQFFQFFAAKDRAAANWASDTAYDVRLVLPNIVGMLPGRSLAHELVIFSAHYDHLGTAGNRIFYGANDNASGVSVMLALAGKLAQTGSNERTVVFCAFAGEELGLLGSTHFVDNLEAQKIVAVINLEMLGRSGATGNNGFFLTGSRYSNLEQIFRKKLEGGKVKLRREEVGWMGDLFERSDNYPFARLGMVAHTVMSSDDRDGCYHRPCDNWRSLNTRHMANVADALLRASTGLLDGTDTPVLRHLPLSSGDR